MPVSLAFPLLFYLKLAQHRQSIIFEFGNQKRGFCNVANGVKTYVPPARELWRQLYRVFLNLTFAGQIFRLLLKHDFSYFDFERNMYMPAFW